MRSNTFNRVNQLAVAGINTDNYADVPVRLPRSHGPATVSARAAVDLTVPTTITNHIGIGLRLASSLEKSNKIKPDECLGPTASPQIIPGDQQVPWTGVRDDRGGYAAGHKLEARLHDKVDYVLLHQNCCRCALKLRNRALSRRASNSPPDTRMSSS